MRILTFSGSSRPTSSNVKLLKGLKYICSKHEFVYMDRLYELPLFRAELDQNPLPHVVKEWRSMVSSSDAVIISTPEYVHNIPASIKNALEWLTSSGELVGKPLLAITLTPHEPRGERAMQSLLWTLKALDGDIKGQLSLYNNLLVYDLDGRIIEDYKELLEISIETLTS